MSDPGSNLGDVGYTVSTTDYFSARASRYEMSQTHLQFLDIPKLTTRDQQHSHLDIDGLLKRLISINPISLHQDVQARRLPGTGEWFIESAVFKQWVIPQAQQVLLCQGIPGAGKTTITSLVIDENLGSFAATSSFNLFETRRLLKLASSKHIKKS